MGFRYLLVLSLAAAACGDDSAPPADAGGPDAALDAGGSDAGVDAGMSYLFGPCSSNAECPGPGGVCLTTDQTGFREGMCTRECPGGDRTPCDDGIRFNECTTIGPGGSFVCQPYCQNGAHCDGLREGYTCQIEGSDMSGVCIGVCDADEQCAPGKCNLWSGQCVPSTTVFDGSENGGLCNGNADCRSGFCNGARDSLGATGWTAGYCLGTCIMPVGYNSSSFFEGDDLPRGTCPTGDVCFPNGSLTQRDLGLCLAGCTTDADCRADEAYFCRHQFAGGDGRPQIYNNGVCWPIACPATPCPDGYMCQTTTIPGGMRSVCVRM
jgi:hypothetical protein